MNYSKNMESIGKRIEQVRLELGLTKSEIWKPAGLSSGVYRQWLDGAELKSDNLYKVAKILGVRPEWLLSGKGDKKLGSKVEITLPKITTEITAINGDVIEIPMLPLEKTIPDNCNNFNFAFIHGLKLSRRWAEKKLNVNDLTKLTYLHNYGNSMQRTIGDGDILLIDTSFNNFVDDHIFVLEVKNKYLIKRVHIKLDGTIELSTDANLQKSFEILDNSIDYKIVGRVAWVWDGKGI